MTKKTTVVSVFTYDWEKLKKIKASKGFPNYAETVGYILQKFPEMIPAEQPKKIAPVIDAEKSQAAAFLAKDKERERQLEPTKKNVFSIERL